MNTHDFLSIASKLLFFLLMFYSIRMGDGFGIALTAAGFLIIENFIEDLADTLANK